VLERLSGQRVLVTGASGFIGSQLCRALVGLGADVHALSREDRTSPRRSQPRWWRCDVRDLDALRRVVADTRPAAIFHLAGLATGSRALELVLPVLHTNLLGAVHVLQAATESGCGRVVLAGSLEEPGGGPAEATPGSPYAAAKGAAAGYARMYHALYGTPVVHARLFMVYGPGQLDLRKLVPYVTVSLLRNRSPLLSSGSRPVDWIFVDDVIAGLLAAATQDAAVGATVELGSGALVPVGDVAVRLARLIASEARVRPSALPERLLERVRAADRSATEQRLGWSPQVSLDAGLARTVEWYRAQLHAGKLDTSALDG
jgi:nucleoside-diphosphate-sugar epimerase